MLSMSEKLLNKLKKIARASVVAGWVDGNKTAAEAYAHLQAKQATGKNQPALTKPVSLALIARTLNYGRLAGQTLGGTKYPAIPARPFMEFAKKELSPKLPKILKKHLPRLIRGEISEKQFYEVIGSYMAGAIKEAMTNGAWVPLSQTTLKLRRHGGNKPLIDTGTLRASVSFEVREK